MAKLTWAQKLNNRLRNNWNVKIDFSKCFTADACGKRDNFGHSKEIPVTDEKWHRIYDKLLIATTKDKVTITQKIDYDWGCDEDYQYCLRNETEYYGTCYGYVLINVTTPSGKHKFQIDSRYA